MDKQNNDVELYKIKHQKNLPDEDDEDEECIVNGKNIDDDEEEDENDEKRRKSVKRFIVLSLTTFIVFVIFILIVTLFIYEGDNWMVDKYDRYLRLIPAPNAPKNTIRFRHGAWKANKKDLWPQLTKQMKKFLESYDSQKTLTGFKNITTCDEPGEPNESEVCHWNTDEIQSLCKLSENFGYSDGTPCIFIAFKTIMNFQVEPYNASDIDTIGQITKDGKLNYQIGQSYMFLECKGNTVVDIENAGTIEFAPKPPEFPKYFFPYTGHPDYMAPFIALRFLNPKTNIVIGITCRLWAKNLTHSDGYSPAELPFNIFID